jgi:hypothetical protein
MFKWNEEIPRLHNRSKMLRHVLGTPLGHKASATAVTDYLIIPEWEVMTNASSLGCGETDGDHKRQSGKERVLG